MPSATPIDAFPAALAAPDIAALCKGRDRVAIEVVAETGSTNADLLARAASLGQPTLLAAETQTAGRGRAGRSWLSAPGSALTFSLAWKFARPLHELSGLPLAVGVAVAETLECFGVSCKLKWPNDILLDGGKLGGILIETAAAAPDPALAPALAPRATWAIIGIGLNLSLPEDLALKIGTGAAAMPALQADRNRLLAALLDHLLTILDHFEAEGFGAFQERWNLLHAHAGQAVSILDHGQCLHQGIAVGVDVGGRLLLESLAPGREQIAVIAGDVSLRSAGARD